MERTVLMIRPEQRIKLVKLANIEHVSIAEINRRAIDAYNPNLSTEEEELSQLADAIIQSSKQAAESLKQARLAVKETLAYFAHKRDSNVSQ